MKLFAVVLALIIMASVMGFLLAGFAGVAILVTITLFVVFREWKGYGPGDEF